MELANEDDPLIKVTWHIERSLLRWLTDQSRESGAPRAAIARRLLAEGMVRQVTGGTASPGMILPAGVGRRNVAGAEVVGVEPVAVPDERVAEVGVGRKGRSAVGVVPVAGEPVASPPSGGTGAAPVSRRAHRWVSVAKDSPVKHCERCHLTERAWRKHGGQPEVCDG